MKINPRLVTTFLFLSLLFFQNGRLIAESRTELPGLEWERRLGDDKFRHIVQAITLSEKDSSIWIAGTSSLAERVGEAVRFWVWKLNDKGQKIQEIEFNNPHKGRRVNPAYPYIRSLVVMENGELLLVSGYNEFNSLLVRIGQNGKPLSTKALSKPGSDTTISKIVSTTDQAFLLIGNKSDSSKRKSQEAYKNALVMKVDAEGTILWERTFDRGKNTSFIEGYSEKEGGTILIGNIGAYCPFCIGSSEVWVVKLDREGDIQSEQTVPGQNGSLAKSQTGSYVILYDKNDFMGKDQLTFTQEVWLQAFDSDLNRLWQTQLFSVKSNFGRFSLASVASDGFIVVGSKENQFWASEISLEGKEVWQLYDAGNIDRMSANYHIVSMNDQFFVLYAAYSKNKEGQLNTKVGLIKFILK